MGNLRVQEEVKNGRIHLSQRSYPDIKSALLEMRVRIRNRLADYNRYDATTDSIKNDAEIQTDQSTYFTIISGRSERRFTLVLKRGDKPVPFGHLIKRGR